MENAQPGQKTNKYLVKLLIAIAVIGVVSSAVLASLNQKGSTNAVAVQGATSQQDAVPPLVPLTVTEMNHKALSDSKPTVIETHGTIVKKISVVYPKSTSYLLGIEDGGSKALIVLKSLDQYKLFKIGDSIKAIGAFGSGIGQCDAASIRDTQMATLCNQLGNAWITSPTMVLVPEIMQYYGNQSPISVTSTKSTGTATIAADAVISIAPATASAKTAKILPLTYGQIMQGLTGTLTMSEFTMGNNHGYSDDSATKNLSVSFIIFASDKENVSRISLEMFDPSIGDDPHAVTFPSDFTQYRTLHNQILSQLLANIFPGWNSRVEWVDAAIGTCKQSGTEQSTVQGSMKITVNCSTTLGSYGVEIEPQ